MHEMTIRSRFAVGVVAIALCSVVVVPVLWLFLPDLDQAVGVLTGRALRLIQNHVENGKMVTQIVLERFGNVRWQAYHRDYLGETYVRCDAVDRSGSPVAMVWVVMMTPERNGVLAYHVRTITTAHNRAALDLTPDLYQAGHPTYKSPDMANW